MVQVPFQVPLEVNAVLMGFNGDGGCRFIVDSQVLSANIRNAIKEMDKEQDVMAHLEILGRRMK